MDELVESRYRELVRASAAKEMDTRVRTMSDIGTAVRAPPRPAIGAITPAVHHCRNPSTADPEPGWSGTSPEASAPALGPIRPWAVMSKKKPTTATPSGMSNHNAPTRSSMPAEAVAARPTAMTTRVGIRPARRAATSVATVSPTALAAKSIEYITGDSPFIDWSTNAEVAT